MISNLFSVFCIVQNDTLYFVGNIFSCVLFEKGSYGIYRTVNFSDELQRLRLGASAKPRYALLLGHCRKVVCNAVKLCIDFVIGTHRASRSLLCDFFCLCSSLARYSLA